MRAALLASAALAAVSLFVIPIHAEEIKALSKIDAVTVYPQGAEVTRLVKTRVNAGEHTVILSDLPAMADPSSIRVEGRATGSLQIGSVDSRRLGVPRDDAATQASERRRIETEIEKMRDDKALLLGAIAAAEAQKKLITNLVELPNRPAPPAGSGAAAPPDWGQLLGLVGERLEKAQHTIVDLGIKVRETDRTIEDLMKKAQSFASQPNVRTEVKVFVNAAQAVDAELVVRYQVGGASWAPLYDARLATGSKGVAAKLQIVRRAMVQQRSGEAWGDVALSLSTARPSAATAVPNLNMLALDFEQERPVARQMSAPAAPPSAGLSGRADPRREAGIVLDSVAKSKQPELEQVQEQTTEVTSQAFQTIYAVPGRVAIPETGEAKRLLIGQDEIEPQLLVKSVPRLDQTAYLYAKLNLPKTIAPFPAGQVALFRDGVFSGTGRMPQLAAGETHELGFGADDQVKVRRVVLEDKKGESGVFTTSQVSVHAFEISVKNLRGQPLAVSIMDRMPVSMQQDIKVDATFRPEPNRRDLEGKRGTVVWDVQVAPDEEKVLSMGYRITAPVGRKLSYAEPTPDQMFQGAVTKF